MDLRKDLLRKCCLDFVDLLDTDVNSDIETLANNFTKKI